MGEEKFDDICANITACLTSSKRKVSISELNKDYHCILGEYIPYRKCGFKTLEDLVRSLPNVRLSVVGSEIFIDAKPDEKTAHIVDLVRNQKPAKKKSKGNKYGMYNKKSNQWKQPDNRNSSNCSNSYSSDTYNKSSSGRYDKKSHKNSYKTSKNDGVSNHVNGSYNNRKYIDWDQPEDESYLLRKYKSSRPSDLDFSEGEHDDFVDYDDFLDDLSPTGNDEQSALDNFTNLHVTLDKGRKVSDKKDNVLTYRTSKSNWQDDDVGYSSMNEVSLNQDFASSERSFFETDSRCTKTKKSDNKAAQLRGPAAIIAAGRAMKKPINNELNLDDQVSNLASSRTGFHLSGTQVENLYSGSPFKTLNRQPQKDTTMEITPDSFFTAESSKAASSKTVLSEFTSAVKPSNSKMSDPTMFRTGPDCPQYVEFNYGESTFCGQLLMFAVKHDLPYPQFTNFTKFDPKTKFALYMCKIKIGEHLNFSTCPLSYNLLREAQENVAKIAYEELCRRYENMEKIILPVTGNKQKIISRVTEIVSSYSTGLKSDAVEMKYKLMHNERLPDDWLLIIKDLSLLSVEKLVGGNFLYPPEDGKGIANISKLPPLTLPEMDEWPIFITCCLSTNSVYFRIIHEDYNGAFEAMSEKMDEIYSSSTTQLQPVEIVKEGNFYAALLNEQWFRVKALGGVVDGIVRVSLIDHGDTDDISKEVIYPLDETLVSLPAQAIRCGLYDLEQYYTNSYVSQITHNTIIGQTLIARVESRNPHLLLTLFDTTGTEDVNCNEKIKEEIQTVLSPPKVPGKGNVKSVYLTSLQEDGHAHVQVISDCFKFLKSLLVSVNEKLSKNEEKYTMKSVSELVGNKVFLAKYQGDGMWHRATVQSLTSDNQVEVKFVDYGNIDIVPLGCIASIQHFTDVLGAIAFQAVEVRLIKPTNELFTQTLIEFLMSIAQSVGDDENSPKLFMMKVIKDDPVPDVQLSLRMSDTNKLVALNDIIGTYFPEYRSPTFSEIEQSSVYNTLKKTPPKRKVLNKKNDTLSVLPEIKPYAVPEAGTQFNVYVSMVSHPSYFIVQPFEYYEQLQSLSEDMKRFYSIEKPAVDVTMIKVGQAFAVERSDGRWCRGVVTLVMTDLNSLSVKCVDFGDTLSVNYQNVYVLLPCFRELPALAIKAELAGIRPVFCEWNMTDSIRFKNLVAQKTFAGIPVDINEGGISLMLIDTTGETEIDIGAILVSEGRARDITLEI